jgi:DNA-directed RNA polymerase specialized sigma24 family protein
VAAARAGRPEALSIAWVRGVARHKVIDHYRKAARDERRLMLLAVAGDDVDDSLALAGQDPARIVQAFGFARCTVAPSSCSTSTAQYQP